MKVAHSSGTSRLFSGKKPSASNSEVDGPEAAGTSGEQWLMGNVLLPDAKRTLAVFSGKNVYLATKKFNPKTFCLTSSHLQHPFKRAEGPTKYQVQQQAVNRGLIVMSSGDPWGMFSQPKAQD